MTVMFRPFPVRVPLPGSYRRRPLRWVHAQWGVCTLFGLPCVPSSLSAILLNPFEFPPSSQRSWRGNGKKEGEVSDPPFFVTRRSRPACPCPTTWPVERVAQPLRYHSTCPCGKAPVKPPEETLRSEIWTLAKNTQRIYLLVGFANLMIAERSGVTA